MRLLTYSCLLILVSCSGGKEIFAPSEFSTDPVSTILSIGAHSVVRNSETIVEIKDESVAYLTVKKAITIYEKDNKDIGQIVLGYSPLREIEYINANITDKNGNVVRQYTMDDASDYTAFDGFSFFSDNRVKVLNVMHNSFPYTIQFEYQMKYNGTLFLPVWYPQDLKQSVQKASLKVIDKTESGIRYYSKNLKDEPEELKTSEGRIIKWEVDFLTSKNREDFGPPVSELLPVVRLAPSKFEIEQTHGDASTWEDFGKWYYSLGEGTRELSLQAKAEIDNVLEGVEGEKDKIEALYNYLQTKTRYVSIQLGIGGWKPFSAEYVFSNEYGDCKALTNYMQAILEYAGIASNPVLISSGAFEPPMITEFPSNQFNHVILRVELENGEYIWLECTSKYYPPGHIGSGNENKNALMISSAGGEIIETPTSTLNDNLSSSISYIELQNDGSAFTDTKISNFGTRQEYLLNVLRPVSESSRVEWLENQINESNYKLTNSDFSDVESNENGVSYSYKAEISNFASTSGSRIFIPLKTSNSWSFNPDLDDNRTQEIWLSYEFSERDTVLYNFPEGFDVEASPKSHSIEESFGTYKIDFLFNENGSFEVQRELIISQSKIDAELYKEFRSFFKQVTEYDNAQLVLAKKD